MPKINFNKPNKSQLEIPAGSNLMKSLLDAGLPVASSCGGDGVCGKCNVEVLEGATNLSSEDFMEKDLKNRLKIPSTCRLSCQSVVNGDIKIDTTYW